MNFGAIVSKGMANASTKVFDMAQNARTWDMSVVSITREPTKTNRYEIKPEAIEAKEIDSIFPEPAIFI
jgi:hypothetical protein